MQPWVHGSLLAALLQSPTHSSLAAEIKGLTQYAVDSDTIDAQHEGATERIRLNGSEALTRNSLSPEVIRYSRAVA
ncbi:hypothetical protein YTPLAS18_17030 [Nitrospira sp.]|nr:hypothetical protein YTPLAS18_17030 [Nitrospira sp.]